ncbi:Hypothetical protein RM25_0343 [Propionibacterium freudenreichii subsp. freudenreichii]|nr:Hypothetical protein RM25_0343 [Propionibacterium freudenreichii subsp. freudenreichii]
MGLREGEHQCLPASMKGPSRRRGNGMVGDGPPDHIDASMKGPSRRRGNDYGFSVQELADGASMKGPSRRRGNLLLVEPVGAMWTPPQ